MKTKTRLKRFIKPIALWLTILQIGILLQGATFAKSGTIEPYQNKEQHLLNHRADVLKILSVLENKIEDQKLLERAKEKLLTLSERQTRLMASLSERIAKEGNTTGGDIAFLLITALITLS